MSGEGRGEGVMGRACLFVRLLVFLDIEWGCVGMGMRDWRGGEDGRGGKGREGVLLTTMAIVSFRVLEGPW